MGWVTKHENDPSMPVEVFGHLPTLEKRVWEGDPTSYHP